MYKADRKFHRSANSSDSRQFQSLVLHFLDRFFNNESVSLDGEALPLIMSIATAIAVPTLIVAIFVFPSYHAFPPKPPIPPFWDRTAEHLFYVTYSLVAMGIVTVFEADMLFPHLLDLLVLSPLPLSARTVVLARVSASILFLGGFLLGINSLGILAYPPATELHVECLFPAQLIAVLSASIFAAASLLAIQGTLIVLLSARTYQFVSTGLQAFSIAALLLILFSFVDIYPILNQLIHSSTSFVRWYPPFWFLGMYERILGGPSALPEFRQLAQTGYSATLIATLIAITTYPLAYVKRTVQSVEGAARKGNRLRASLVFGKFVDSVLLRSPAKRAIYNFIGQTIRTPRHRTALALYAGLGAALLLSGTIRLHISDGHLQLLLSPIGLRSAVPGVAFWTIAGLCSALTMPADPAGAWIFRVIDESPTLDHMDAVHAWVFYHGLFLIVPMVGLIALVSPSAFHNSIQIACLLVVGIGLCLLLSDTLLLSFTQIPFTQARVPRNTDLAWVLVRYLALFPAVVLAGTVAETWVQVSLIHLLVAGLAIAIGHFTLTGLHRIMIRRSQQVLHLTEVDGFIFSLGLRD